VNDVITRGEKCIGFKLKKKYSKVYKKPIRVNPRALRFVKNKNDFQIPGDSTWSVV
jgi:hypothetical protein